MAEERKLEELLIKSCKKFGARCEKFPPVFWTGVPDRLVILPNGGVVWVELKAAKGVLSARQQKAHKTLRSLNQRVEIVSNGDELARFLRSLSIELKKAVE